ncbi:AATF protein, partial [Spelaeornis formosus]|nr:AATF protein [Elachura formosa]
ATVAKVVDRFEDEATDDVLPVGDIRKRASASLLESDQRYSGKATSRKALQEELWGDAESEEGSAEEALDDWYSDNEGSEEEDTVGTKARQKPSSSGSEQEGDEEDDEEDDEGEKLPVEAKAPKFSFQNITDFEKFTEGMDDAGSSEGEDEDEDEDEDEAEDEEEDADMEEGSDKEEESGSENHDDGKETKGSEDDGGVMTFSRGRESEEVEKGKAVRNQLALWDQLMEGRIKMQKVLVTANRLPQPDTYPRFRKEGGQDFDNAVENC